MRLPHSHVHRRFIRCLPLITAMTLVGAPAHAQSPQPYVLGEVGGSVGDGGSAAALAAGFGFLTSKNVGVQLEVSYVPGLDFGDTGAPRIQIFPPILLEATGRILTFETHVVGILPGGGTKLRAFVLAGGGVGSFEQRIRISAAEFTPLFSGFPGFPELPEFPLISFPFDEEVKQTETSLVLSGGGGFDYAVVERLTLGLSVRYQRLFSNPAALNRGRIGLRATWNF